MRRAWIPTVVIGLATLIYFLWWLRPQEEGTPPGPKIPYVVLLTIDSLRADALPWHGNPRVKTPALSALASESIVFENALTPASWTRPSVASMLTGLPPAVHGFNAWQMEIDPGFPASVLTLGECFHLAGYRTAAIGYNPFIANSPTMRRGFRDFQFYPKATEDLDPGDDNFPVNETTDALTQRATNWIVGRDREPFFLWLHYYDPHLPYAPKSKWLSDADRNGLFSDVSDDPDAYRELVAGLDTDLRALNDAVRNPAASKADRVKLHAPMAQRRELVMRLYEAEIRAVDAAVARVVESLKAKGLYDDALIVVTSDHGEEFWDYGEFEHGHATNPTVLHVPLLIKPPAGSAEAGARRVGDRVSTTSVFCTLLDACGLPVAEEQRLAPALLGPRAGQVSEDAFPHLVVQSHHVPPWKTGIYEGSMKYVETENSLKAELYDLTYDPEERQSIAQQNPTAVRRGKSRLRVYREWAAALKKRLQIRDADANARDERMRSLLKSHGYIR